MPVSKSSASSLLSKTKEIAGVVLLLAAISAAAAVWCASRGYTLYYGDAEAHLNIARRVLDSRTPGPYQLGTVWLPLPHLLMIPFVMNGNLWKSGLAGVIPSAACFVLAGVFLFAAARRLFASAGAGIAAALLFALNPNMLYLQSTPMTEAVFAASLAALLWATLWYRDSQSIVALLAAVTASNAASLTRYEGWFLIPFVALFILITSRRKSHALIFAALAALGPAAWLAHNQFYYSNALEFYNGEYSAKAIYARQLAQGVARYPGDHDWRKAIEYYFAAMTLTSGLPLLIIGALGAIAALVKKTWWPLVLLGLPPVFYIWSIHSSGTPIYVPGLKPNGWYNTRYALAVLPLAALCAGALVAMFPRRVQTWAAASLAVGISITWAFSGPPVCWKESQVNSVARRAWTQQGADFLGAHYIPGSTILYTFGDLSGILRQAGIPMRNSLHQGNVPAWDAATLRPELFLHEEWALAIPGDRVAEAILRAQRSGLHYELQKRIIVEGAPEVDIYQRPALKNRNEDPLYQSPRRPQRLPAHLARRSARRNF
jgi:hypothetical protein